MNSKHHELWSLDSKNFPKSGLFEEQVKFMLAYASLAPSGHNTQPWLFKIHADHVELIADRSRSLPIVDPESRELLISCGAAMETFLIAAHKFGVEATIEIMPSKTGSYEHTNRDVSSDILAIIYLKRTDLNDSQESSSHQQNELFNAITARRTNRNEFAMEALPEELFAACKQIASRLNIELNIIQDENKRLQISELVAEGDRQQFSNPAFRKELGSWVRSAKFGDGDGMSGASFGMPDILSPIGHFVIRTFDIGKSIASDNEHKISAATPALILLGSHDDNKGDWLTTGRALARILLFLTTKGYSASYLNQPIEISGLRPTLRTLVNMPAWPQILLRVGKATESVQASARRDVSEIIVE